LKDLSKKVALQALDCSTQPIVIVSSQNASLPVAYVNTAFETLTGLDAAEVMGGRLDKLVANGPIPERAAQRRPDINEDYEQTWRIRGGRKLRLSVRLAPLFDDSGRPAYWLLTVLGPLDSESPGGEAALRDALHDARRKLRRLERTDSATGVPNAAAFYEILQRDWAMARREQRRLGIVVFQVDYLDEYRDKIGRHATDSVLRKIAHAIHGSLRRAGDFGARVGDARFAVVLGLADDSQVREFAERAVKKVNNLAIPHPKSPVARHVTISFGTASETPEWSSTCNVLFEIAEQHLVENLPVPVADREGNETGATTRTDLLHLSH